MTHSPIGGKGGTFCQFTVGSAERGESARHLRYIANRQAVRDGRDGVWLQGFPALLIEAPYVVLVQHLYDWAHWLEQEEILRHRGPGEVRTHYQAILSFETSLPTVQAKSLLTAWMQEAFPNAQAAAFVHRNTNRLHLHVWIAARQTDGRKINLSARAFRQLDEKWNFIYSQALNRDVWEHLLKKGQTERYKELQRAGTAKEVEPPSRVGHFWSPAEFNERERQRLGATLYDSDKTGVGRSELPTARDALATEKGERIAAFPEPGVATEAAHVQQALKNAEQAVSEASQLHQDASRLAPREPEPSLEIPRRQETERER